jgi:hypothetical protein
VTDDIHDFLPLGRELMARALVSALDGLLTSMTDDTAEGRVIWLSASSSGSTGSDVGSISGE